MFQNNYLKAIMETGNGIEQTVVSRTSFGTSSLSVKLGSTGSIRGSLHQLASTRHVSTRKQANTRFRAAVEGKAGSFPRKLVRKTSRLLRSYSYWTRSQFENRRGCRAGEGRHQVVLSRESDRLQHCCPSPEHHSWIKATSRCQCHREEVRNWRSTIPCCPTYGPGGGEKDKVCEGVEDRRRGASAFEGRRVSGFVES